jgi:hypothetical protein
MATTTNYSWTTPDNTAYVKDGASAIRTLGSSVDTTLFAITSGKNVGLPFISTTTFSAASSVAVNSVFTSAFESYRIVCTYTSSVNGSSLSFKFRVGGVDNSANSYFGANQKLTHIGTAANQSANAATSAPIGFNAGSTNTNSFTLDVVKPTSTAQAKNATGATWGTESGTASYYAMGAIGFTHASVTAFDGFSLIPSSGTITGTVQVFGYRNS